MEFLEKLEWRYATKKYDATRKVSSSDLDQILEAARLAPSSSGLQQYRIILVSDQAIKEKMVAIAWGQEIVSEASHILIFAAWDKYTDERIDRTFDKMNLERDLPLSTTDEYKNRLKEQMFIQSDEQQASHTAKQAYIGLGFAMAQAAILKIDSTPMEGFDNKELDKYLGLQAKGLKSVVMLALGYREEKNDWLLNLKKFRLPKDEFIIDLELK